MKGPLLVLAGALCFSTTGTVQALAPAEAEPLVLGFLRMLGGTCALAIWCAARGMLSSLLPLSDWPPMVTACAALGMCSFQTFFFAALPLAGVTVGTVVTLGVTPMAVGVLGWFILREKPRRIWYMATTLAICGVLVLALAKNDTQAAVSPTGLALAVCGGISYALFVIMSKLLVARRGVEASLCVIFAASALGLLPVLAFMPGNIALGWVLTPGGLTVCVVLALFCTAVPYFLTLSGLRSTPVSLASTLALGEPLGASFLGILLLGEPVTSMTLLGLGLLFVSMTILVKS